MKEFSSGKTQVIAEIGKYGSEKVLNTALEISLSMKSEKMHSSTLRYGSHKQSLQNPGAQKQGIDLGEAQVINEL